MRQETINIYQFEELPEDKQEIAIEYFRQANDYPFLSEDIAEELKHQLEKAGIEILDKDKMKVSYSLSYCQGDGAMFEGKFKWNGYHISIVHAGHYHYYNSKVIDIEDDNGDSPDSDVYNKFNNIYVGMCRDLEKYGYARIEYEDSKESIVNLIDANDYEFYGNGKLIGCTA